MERKINYMLATWSGNRRLDRGNPANYLRTHIEQLNILRHNLAHISIGYPKNPDESPEFTEYINELKQLDDGTPITVHSMMNSGLSYGQYSRMFEHCYKSPELTDCTHHIFMEDDYVPYLDHFDKILADMFDEKHDTRNCGYLCGLVQDRTGRWGKFSHYSHAAISNGISNREVLAEIFNEHWCLPHLWKHCLQPEQVVFSQAFWEAGFTVLDYLDQFKCGYLRGGRRLESFGKQGEYLLVPIQFLENGCRIQEKSIDSLPHYRRLQEKAERMNLSSVDDIPLPYCPEPVPPPEPEPEPEPSSQPKRSYKIVRGNVRDRSIKARRAS